MSGSDIPRSGMTSVAARLTDPVNVTAACTAFAALLVGVLNIGRSFGYDEAVTYHQFINGGSVRRALTTQLVFNNHQLFSASQALLWRSGLVGETPQRLAPVLCGTATVGLLTWWLGRHVSAVAGTVAGLFLLLNPVYLPEYRSLRGYSLATLAVLVAALTTHRSWSDHRLRWPVVSAVAMVVAVTTHSYSVVGVAMIAVATIAMGCLRRQHIVAWASAAIVAFVIQLPLLDDARRNSEARGSRDHPGFLRFVAESYLGRRDAVIAVSAILALVGAVVIARRSTRHLVVVVASSALFAGIVVLLAVVIRPYDLYVRFFVSLTPYLAALVGIGAASIPRHIGAVAAVTALALLVPNLADVVRSDPPNRDAALVVDAARDEGLTVCGAYTIPLAVYTEPVRPVDAVSTDGLVGYLDCEVFVAVIGIGSAGRAAAAERFEARANLGGGLTIYGPEGFVESIPAIIGRAVGR